MNSYLPDMAKIIKVKKETPDVKTFQFSTGKKIDFLPGQVLMATAFGFGESTFGIIPTEKKKVYEFSVKETGRVTEKLFRMKKGDKIGIRGPFGNGYPLEEMEGKNVILVAGGIGSPPIKSLILCMLKEKKKYGNISFYYGARSPKDIVYEEDLEKWKNKINVGLTVDKGTKDWKGNVGVVTELLEEIDTENSIACMCGPCVMSKFVTKKLKEKGMNEKDIYVSMERMMQCGMGMCGHCNIGKTYVCKDGPVFRLDELLELTEEVW